MQVILLESLSKLGKAGEIVTVKSGFAKNFLLPKNKAIVANEINKKDLENRLLKINSDNSKKIDKANLLKSKINSKIYKIEMESNEEGNLYGSISQQNIVNAISENSELINADSVILPQIKKLGDYTVTLRLYEDITADVGISVVKK
tara:strand:+ start:41 stop:481 length:441 start_codon:yes stop_codon:yes gene_type:complete